MSAAAKRADCRWTAFVPVPDFVAESDVEAARASTLSALARQVALRRIDEGPAVQVLHVGPYENEGPTVERLHVFAAKHAVKIKGKHHEVYLRDPRQTPPEKLKTIVRLGVR